MNPQQQPAPPYSLNPEQPAPEDDEDFSHISHEIDPETEAKHKESVMRYPELHLSPGEYVILAVRRHPIGLISIWSVVILVTAMVFALLPLYALNRTALASTFGLSEHFLPSAAALTLPLFGIVALFVLGAIIATVVYVGNRFYITNESIIQHIQTSLFSTNEQTVNLRNIEDASYRQQGVLQQILDYGSIRLSTEGDETTYRFNYVARPRNVARVVVDTIEHAMGLSSRWRKRPGMSASVNDRE